MNAGSASSRVNSASSTPAIRHREIPRRCSPSLNAPPCAPERRSPSPSRQRVCDIIATAPAAAAGQFLTPPGPGIAVRPCTGRAHAPFRSKSLRKSLRPMAGSRSLCTNQQSAAADPAATAWPAPVFLTRNLAPLILHPTSPPASDNPTASGHAARASVNSVIPGNCSREVRFEIDEGGDHGRLAHQHRPVDQRDVHLRVAGVGIDPQRDDGERARLIAFLEGVDGAAAMHVDDRRRSCWGAADRGPPLSTRR